MTVPTSVMLSKSTFCEPKSHTSSIMPQVTEHAISRVFVLFQSTFDSASMTWSPNSLQSTGHSSSKMCFNYFSSKILFMVALCNTADHYIFILWFLLSSSFPCLISAVADWMSAILPHMVWP